MKTAEFISTFDWYVVESSGVKPYTIRDKTLRTEKKIEDATHIRIRKGYTKESFTKKITHIMNLDKYVIIAWNPNKGEE